LYAIENQGKEWEKAGFGLVSQGACCCSPSKPFFIRIIEKDFSQNKFVSYYLFSEFRTVLLLTLLHIYTPALLKFQ
jgi:hypothetical protein